MLDYTEASGAPPKSGANKSKNMPPKGGKGKGEKQLPPWMNKGKGKGAMKGGKK